MTKSKVGRRGSPGKKAAQGIGAAAIDENQQELAGQDALRIALADVKPAADHIIESLFSLSDRIEAAGGALGDELMRGGETESERYRDYGLAAQRHATALAAFAVELAARGGEMLGVAKRACEAERAVEGGAQ